MKLIVLLILSLNAEPLLETELVMKCPADLQGASKEAYKIAEDLGWEPEAVLLQCYSIEKESEAYVSNKETDSAVNIKAPVYKYRAN